MFTFKQFVIDDSQCAMKVGTDSIMLGSWVAVQDANHILDIGTGSGLLSLMLAQKAPPYCQILGIDIEDNAIQQAQQNSLNCPWAQQLVFKSVALQALPQEIKYDLIVSNPPYFPINHTANQQPVVDSRVNARQTLTLNHEVLLSHVVSLLTKNGRFCCVLPADVAQAFIHRANMHGLYCSKKLDVSTKPKTEVKRVLLEFGFSSLPCIAETLVIYTASSHYSVAYKTLCKDFYLNF